MELRQLFHYSAFLAVFAVTTSCSEDEDPFSLVGDNYSVSDIAGSWTATSALYSLDAEGPVQEFDIVADGGGMATLDIQTNGRFTFTTMLPGEGAQISSGRLGFDEDALIVSFDNDPDEYDYYGMQFSPGNLTIQGHGVEFDFDGDGIGEPAQIYLALIPS